MTQQKRRGRLALFRGKRRAPVSITLTPRHHAKVRRAMRRLTLTRADLLGLLIEHYADTVTYTIETTGALRRCRSWS